MSVEGNEGFLEIPNASLRVSGNVHAEGIKLGVVELIPSYDLASVSNVGNTTTQTVQFTNPTTSLVASSNIVMLNTANTAQNVELSVGENTNVYTRMSYLSGDKLNYHEAGDYFGYSVSLSGDGKVAAVAAPWDDDGGANSGAAFVFVQNSMGEWNKVQKLRASDGVANDYFGSGGVTYIHLRGISVSGDGSIIVVGANYAHAPAADSGAAYIFEKTGSTWTQFQKIVASDGAASDYFGSSVCVSRDGSTIAIGTPYDDDNSAEASGSVYMFEKVGGNWTQVQKLTAGDPIVDAHLSSSGVQLTDDGTTLLVGAHAPSVEAAYIFDKAANGTWSQTQKIQASNTESGDQFASSIDISGDGTVICCGAINEDTGATNKGAAYIFVKSAAGAWSQTETQFIQASDGTTSDSFGLGVSVSQNGDRILVGSHLDDTGEGDSGSMYIFDRTNGVWTQTNHLYPGHATGPGGYGMSSAISDDGKVYMVGSPYDETAGGTDNGAVFVYDEKSYIERKNYIGLRCPVLFSASSIGIDYAGGAGSSATIIKWNIVYRNWGGGYDPKTGIFTAPIAGYYKFDTFINSANVGVHWIRFAWFKNGNIYHPHYEPGAYEEHHTSISGSIVVDLEVGDTFDVRVTYNTMYAYHGNGFTGFYLSP